MMWLSSVIVQSKVGIRRNTKPFTTLFPRVGGRVNQSADFKFDTHILFSTHTFFHSRGVPILPIIFTFFTEKTGHIKRN